MAEVPWYSAADATAQTRLAAAWDDAPIENVELCQMLLDVAQEQVTTYAPAGVVPTAPANPPSRLVLAQLMHARALWIAGRTTDAGLVGPEGFSYTPRPLDKPTRETIRPRDPRPNVY